MRCVSRYLCKYLNVDEKISYDILPRVFVPQYVVVAYCTCKKKVSWVALPGKQDFCCVFVWMMMMSAIAAAAEPSFILSYLSNDPQTKYTTRLKDILSLFCFF